MRSACALGFGLAVLFAVGTARAQEESTKAKPVPSVSVIVIEVQPGQIAGPVQRPVPAGVVIGRALVPPGTIPAAVTPTTKAQAPSPPAPQLGLFQAMDVNKDGKISAAEFKGPQAVFAAIDANHDGSITRPEATGYLAFVGLMSLREKAREFRAMDTNKDGKVSQSEFKGAKEVFARIDADHDGAVTRDEAIRAFNRRVHRAMVLAQLRSMDANHDGVISASEFKGSVPRFLRLDVDHDGTITRADLAKVFRAAPGQQAARTTKPVAPAPKTTGTLSATKVVAPIAVKTASQAGSPITLGPWVKRILAMDTNQDGKVCKAEYLKAAESRFAYLDQDKDGYITAAEIAKVVQGRRPNPVPAAQPAPAGKPIQTAEPAANGVKTAGVAKKP
jgi:Ca2+-binding EF-hand superfamily protein